MSDPTLNKERWGRIDTDAEEAFAELFTALPPGLRPHVDRVISWCLLEMPTGTFPDGGQAAIFKVWAHSVAAARDEWKGDPAWDEPCRHKVRPSEGETLPGGGVGCRQCFTEERSRWSDALSTQASISSSGESSSPSPPDESSDQPSSQVSEPATVPAN